MSWKPISLAHTELTETMILFCQKLVQTPSFSGNERNCAELILTKMQGLRFDTAEIDKAGNVTGLVKGTDETAPKILLSAHIDHASFEDAELWQFPPFSGTITDNKIFGRGSADSKGAIASQIYGLAAVLEAGLRPKSDVYFAYCVQEETGGTGMRYFIANSPVKFDVAIVGNPTYNNINLGHRGVTNIEITFFGKSVHTSKAESGVNPHYAAAKFLVLLENELANLPEDKMLGKSMISPTLYQTDKTQINEIPNYVKLVLGWRLISETKEEVLKKIREIAGKISFEGVIEICKQKNITYKGFREGLTDDFSRAFLADANHEFIKKAVSQIEEVTGKKASLGIWKAANDGRFIAQNGTLTFGFSPGDEKVSHIRNEFVEIPMLVSAMKCYSKFVI
ncbi:M20/M25/M40 family metallo-hydrolase [bacterium]|nr:M20/M25/M40 family metallo-hydrolase [bacterium]